MEETTVQTVKKEFNYRRYAKFLIIGGIVGGGLTIIFTWMLPVFSGLTLPWLYSSRELLIGYYAINSFLVFASGVALSKRKPIGLVLLLLVFFSIFASIAVVEVGTNLFIYTVTISLFAIPFGAPLGVLIFLGSVVINIFKLRQWAEELNVFERISSPYKKKLF